MYTVLPFFPIYLPEWNYCLCDAQIAGRIQQEMSEEDRQAGSCKGMRNVWMPKFESIQ